MLLHQLFEATVERVPDKIALVTEAGVHYRDLDGLASSLAARLQTAGVRRGDRVAIFADNGMEAVVGVYGVLKAGAVFMPVNPLTRVTSSPISSTTHAAPACSRPRCCALCEPALARNTTVRASVVSGLPAR